MTHLELNEQLHKLSILKDREFTYEITNHKFKWGGVDSGYDYSIIAIKTKANWLDLDTIKGIEGLKLSLWGDYTTAFFSISYNK